MVSETSHSVHSSGPVDRRETPERLPAPDALAPLVGEAASGDAAAIRRLLDAVGPSVLRVVRGVLGAEHPDAEDVLQESLLSLVSGLGAFRGECSVMHYACRIGIRTAMGARRRGRAKARVIERSQQSSAGEDEVPSPDQEVLAARRRQLLRGLLDDLPETQAEALALRTVLGLSMEEVAKATGAPLNTVRSRLRLAKEALARRIDREPDLAEELEVAGEPHRPAS